MRTIVRVLCCVVLVLMGLSVWCGAQPTVVREYRVPTTGTDKVFRPRISGDWIMINRIGQYNTPVLSVDMYNTRTQEIYTALNSGNLPWCEFASNQILYSSSSNNVSLYDVTTRTERQIAAHNGPVYRYVPKVWENYVVYQGWGSQIYLLDTNLGTERRISSSSDTNSVPGIDGNVVVWYDDTTKTICGYSITTGQVLNISQPGADFIQPRTDGKTIVCSSNTNGVKAYNIATGVWTSVASAGYFCDVDGNIVIYQNSNAVYGYDMTSGSTFRISSTATVNNGPSIEGNRVIWGTQDSVYCAELSVPEPGSMITLIGAIGVLAGVVVRREKSKS